LKTERKIKLIVVVILLFIIVAALIVISQRETPSEMVNQVVRLTTRFIILPTLTIKIVAHGIALQRGLIENWIDFAGKLIISSILLIVPLVLVNLFAEQFDIWFLNSDRNTAASIIIVGVVLSMYIIDSSNRIEREYLSK
jgi:hypothetical protein